MIHDWEGYLCAEQRRGHLSKHPFLVNCLANYADLNLSVNFAVNSAGLG